MLATADFSYETAQGLSIFGAGLVDYFDSEVETASADGVNFGGILKLAQVLDKENGWEVFGQYDFLILDEEVDGEDFYHEVVAGVNKYWEGHKVKMTIDAALLPVGNIGGSNSGIGYQGDGANDDPQLAIRGQFQLLL